MTLAHEPLVYESGDAMSVEAAARSEPAIVVEGVTKRYTQRRSQEAAALTLDTIDLRVGRGEFVTLVGPSGCGKTTLLKICAGLIAPTSGRVLWCGDDPGPGRRFGMMVFQSAALMPWRTVISNVMFPATVLRWKKAGLRQRAIDLLERLQLQGAADKYPDELSGGMQQRVSIARALFTDPEVLFMDEPFGALDAMTREELNLLLQELQAAEGKTVLFVTHNIQEAVFLSDRVLVMGAQPGRIRDDVAVPMARPRSLDDMIRPEFRAIEARVRGQLGHLDRMT